jgi:hypothetical protein
MGYTTFLVAELWLLSISFLGDPSSIDSHALNIYNVGPPNVMFIGLKAHLSIVITTIKP